jgi:hypothetical protein
MSDGLRNLHRIISQIFPRNCIPGFGLGQRIVVFPSKTFSIFFGLNLCELVAAGLVHESVLVLDHVAWVLEVHIRAEPLAVVEHVLLDLTKGHKLHANL